ncbi:sugar phosphate isomerase/epimerase family protein [Actinophytocola oryzae]|uniref:Xylose isomerase-like TIM barrel protein n=1 Tax=Actinophytocola oryzae TaxID=502181 RepID=A0A4R7VV92_9PSEU|nr:TIM barrel protein [Actinophytocola oryzae]TDV53794.1 xylose isomerase-like TIM barrel protein [Actinophytocola oryzae]
MTLVPGLVSVTFRQLAVPEIVALAVGHGMRAVEWGGDVHVPAGDLATAREVASRCADAGIEIEAYGSYYRAAGDFGPVLATAVALDAPRIRVWAGGRGSAHETERRRVVENLRDAAAQAESAGIEVAVEYHAGTLTDTLASAVALFDEVPALRPYWQPPVGSTLADAREALVLRPVAAHVFSWDDTGRRLPLAARADLWRPVLAELAALPGTRHVLLEFVRDDDPTAFAEDAAVLREWVAGPVLRYDT